MDPQQPIDGNLFAILTRFHDLVPHLQERISRDEPGDTKEERRDRRARRSEVVLDWLVREWTPAWLRLGRYDSAADRVRGLRQVTHENLGETTLALEEVWCAIWPDKTQEGRDLHENVFATMDCEIGGHVDDFYFILLDCYSDTHARLGDETRGSLWNHLVNLASLGATAYLTRDPEIQRADQKYREAHDNDILVGLGANRRTKEVLSQFIMTRRGDLEAIIHRILETK